MILRPILPVLALTSVFAACSSDDGGGEPFVGSGGTSSIAAIGGVAGQTGIATMVGGVGGQTGIATMVGGASAGGVSGQSKSTATSPNTGCPIWPRERFFPAVGPFFYGPDPGPCSSTTNEEVKTYAYDSEQLTGATALDGSVVTTHTYEQGLIVSSTDVMSGGSVATTSYHYGTNSAGYSHVTGTSVTQVEFNLDSLGYPLSAVWSSNQTSTGNSYVYVYEDCLIKQRLRYSADGALEPSQTLVYTYDNEQRLISLAVGTTAFSFDYSCW